MPLAPCRLRPYATSKTAEQQRAKLALVVEVAQEVWG